MSIEQDYIDLDEALSRLRGNKTIYKSLLARFTQNTYIDQLRGEIDSGNFEAASHSAHTIKGVSANLSLKKVYESSIALETQLKAGHDGKAEFQTLSDDVDKTLAMIAELVPTL